MKKTIIAVCGDSDAGKSSSIRHAYEQLLDWANVTVIKGDERAWKEVRGAILEIDGVKVGFASQGDYPAILKRRLDELIEAGCLVIVCATRPKDTGVYRALGELQPEFKIRWIDKQREDEANHQRATKDTASKILRYLRTAIESAILVEA